MCKIGCTHNGKALDAKLKTIQTLCKIAFTKDIMPSSLSLHLAGVIAVLACSRTTSTTCANLTGCLLNSCDYQIQNFNVTCEHLEVRNWNSLFKFVYYNYTLACDIAYQYPPLPTHFRRCLATAQDVLAQLCAMTTLLNNRRPSSSLNGSS